MSGGFGTILTMHMASMISTDGTSTSGLWITAFSDRGMFITRDSTCDFPESINMDPSWLKFDGGATLNSYSSIFAILLLCPIHSLHMLVCYAISKVFLCSTILFSH